eukprot:7021028-Prymnesium_polylepis.1
MFRARGSVGSGGEGTYGFGGRGECAHEAEVGDGPLGRAQLALAPRELVREGDHELAVALALVARQREDAREVVLLARVLLFGEVAHHVLRTPMGGARASAAQVWRAPLMRAASAPDRLRVRSRVG